jgi:epoxide hydrolase-like predicted phosphatase
MMSNTWVDEAMVEAVASTRRRGVKTCLLSNSWGHHPYPTEIEVLFDAMVISARVGMRKPQPEIFELACKEIDVPAAECVFVDDFRPNVEAAEALGIAGILHRDTRDTIAKLDELL